MLTYACISFIFIRNLLFLSDVTFNSMMNKLFSCLTYRNIFKKVQGDSLSNFLLCGSIKIQNIVYDNPNK